MSLQVRTAYLYTSLPSNMIATLKMSCAIRKPAYSIYETKDPDQRLCFRYIVQFLYFLNKNFKLLAILCGCTAWFVSNLLGSLEDRLSHDVAQNVFSKFQYLVTQNSAVKACIKCCKKKAGKSLYKKVKKELEDSDWPPVGQVTYMSANQDEEQNDTQVYIDNVGLDASINLS